MPRKCRTAWILFVATESLIGSTILSGAGTLSARAQSTRDEGEPPRGFRGRVLDPQGHPVEDARVRLVRSGSRSIFGSSPSLAEVQTTDSGGFEILAPAGTRRRELQVSVPGFLLCRHRARDLEEGIVDLGTLVLQQAGTVFGQALGENGFGVPRATVTAFQGAPIPGAFASDLRRQRNVVAESEADAEGHFRLDQLGPGPFRLNLQRLGFRSMVTGQLELGPGETLNLHSLLLPPGIPLTGLLRDEVGQPVVDTAVEIAPVSHGPDLYQKTFSDEEGRFHFHRVGDGRFRLTVFGKGLESTNQDVEAVGEDLAILVLRHGTLAGEVLLEDEPEEGLELSFWLEQVGESVFFGETRGADQDGPDNLTFSLSNVTAGRYRIRARVAGYGEGVSDPVSVDPGQTVSDLFIEVDRGHEVSGWVNFEDGVDAPESVSMRLFSVSFRSESARYRIEAEADGSFRFSGVLAGNYRLEAHTGGPVASLVGPFPVPSEEARELEVFCEKPGKLEGTLRMASREPAQGRLVQLTGPLPSRLTWSWFSRSNGSRSQTDEQGTYQFDNLPAGDYSFHLLRSSAAYFRFESEAEDDDPRVTVRPAETTEFDLELPPRVYWRGRVEGSESPLGRALIVFVGEGRAVAPRSSIRTNADGTFGLGSFEPGNYAIQLWPPAAPAPTLHTFTVAENAEPVTLRAASSTIEGRVVEKAGGEGIVGVRLVLWPEPGAEGTELPRATRRYEHEAGTLAFFSPRRAVPIESGPEGSFAFATVPPGSYLLRAHHPRFVQRDPVRLTIEPSSQTSVPPVELLPAASLDLQIRDADTGHPLHKRTLVLDDGSGNVLSYRAEPEGRHRIAGLSAGTYALRILRFGQQEHEELLDLTVGAAQKLVIAVSRTN